MNPLDIIASLGGKEAKSVHETPPDGGVYIFVSDAGIEYVGQSESVRRRIRGSLVYDPKKHTRIFAIRCDSRKRFLLERQLIKELNPKLNTNLKNCQGLLTEKQMKDRHFTVLKNNRIIREISPLNPREIMVIALRGNKISKTNRTN